ncbi:hypothetical protein RHMOL_Rhmol11G0190600 [Rhododendron molle]|uniref:Uncharacterized protein n=1 Tax=Rhododendron molle TaxID=49168 RepID=A0ACC0LUX3_RHOML|nr:hypothetical protein RHMOL_Rhmol11G0190600 [Rhododendron molle]
MESGSSRMEVLAYNSLVASSVPGPSRVNEIDMLKKLTQHGAQAKNWVHVMMVMTEMTSRIVDAYRSLDEERIPKDYNGRSKNLMVSLQLISQKLWRRLLSSIYWHRALFYAGDGIVVARSRSSSAGYTPNLFSSSSMDIELPFVRCFPKDNRCADGITRSVYYLANFAGDILKVASCVSADGNPTVYRMSSKFREKYGYFFPIGSIKRWNSPEAMLTWANKMIWFSFLARSNKNQGRCWFTKDILTDNWRGYTFFPNWDERFGNSSISSIWILLKNRGKVWPVHVIHNQLGDGWPEFWDSHKLRSGFKVVFGCERSWIFDVVVLMHNLEPLHNYEWSTTAHELQESSLMPYVVEVFGTPRDIRTSCFPSAMSIKDMLCNLDTIVFGKYLRNLFHDAGVDEIFVHMRNRWWSIPRINNRVDRSSLDLLLNDLNLQPLDFLLVTAFDDTDVNVIVFGGDRIERLYPWT